MNKYSLDIFADTPSERSTVNKNDSIILDGEIGEWDPDIVDKPDFENNKDVDEIEGNKPQDGDYYTISVTVPINMEFYVLPHSSHGMGSFFSPMYTITNNGSKNISVSLDSFERKNNIIDQDSVPLYVEKLNHGDKKTQIELKMYGIEDLYTEVVTKEIDLSEIKTLLDDEKKLYQLRANETKGIKFGSKDWELPQMESDKDRAMSNFTSSFVFSIVR
ncbi:MAG: hypothetical protein SOR73_13305 [Romboutsia timonensis]|uniref:hypothetical protein n=1 Tax=Romboutsia timonensis TaxID=1776391 RepID=UPI002A75B3D3|nr:hypothetical protein [Romboutsia timonensis]MDY3002632.1 hypothetical protein [Romboutsia timonensis]